MLLLAATQAAVLAAATVLAIIAIGVAYVGFRVLRSDPTSYRENQRLFGSQTLVRSLFSSIRGNASVQDGKSDYFRVHAGLGFDLRTNELKRQGKLSQEAIRSIHEPSR